MASTNHFLNAIKGGLLICTTAYVIGMLIYLAFRVFWGDEFWWLSLLNEFVWLLFIPLPLTLLSSILLKNRWVFAGNILLTAVALLWFGAYFVPKGQRTANTGTIKIVTFNIWGDNARLDAVNDWLQRVDPDIVLLQEIPFTLADNETQTINNLYPYRISQTTAVRPYGNLFLSRYPILSESELPGAGEGVPAQHRFTVDVNGQTVTIYNVHLAQPTATPRLNLFQSSFVAETIFSYDNTNRNKEIRYLMSQIEGETNPVILAGDLNMSDHAVIYREISDSMVDTFREAGTGFGRSWPVRIVNEIPRYIPPMIRVDYIWHSQDFRTIGASRGPQLGSDHYPFYAEIELLD